MKKTFALIATLCLSLSAMAQQDSLAQHIQFFGIPVQGNITDFTQSLLPRYRLQKKRGQDWYYIYKGPVCGHEMYLRADYSQKSRTVYKVTVTPQHLDKEALLDSMTMRFGEPIRESKYFVWSYPVGTILLTRPEGYDPEIIFLDNEGVAAFRNEQ